MYGLRELSKEYIFKHVSQEEIFEYFLGIEVQIEYLFRSPLRKDVNPTCTFSYHQGTLWFRDWASSNGLDCFNVVEHLYNCDFFTALRIVEKEMILGEYVPKNEYKYDYETRYADNYKSKINVRFGKWTDEVIEYLQSYHITSEQCKKFNIYPIDVVWLNNRLHWMYSDSDPAIAYYFGKGSDGLERWKIYFFKRKNKYRFICNTNRINGWIQLPETGNNLIITKSLKDVVCLDTFNIPAIAMQNESTIPYDYIMDDLKSRFDNIYSFYDFDYAGITNANKLKRKYLLPYIFLTNGRFGTKNYNSKDFSDYLKANGKQKTIELINHYADVYKLDQKLF